MATEKTYESKREEALQMLMANDTPQPKLIRLYMGEIDRRQHSRIVEYKPLLDNAELDVLYRSLPQDSQKTIIKMLRCRQNVMDAALELNNMKVLICGKMNMIIAQLWQWGCIEAMEAAVNIALLAVPPKDRSDRAELIASNMELMGCSQTVEDGLLKVKLAHPIESMGLADRIEMGKHEIPNMFAQYKGCYQAILDYIKKKKLFLPASTIILKEYEQELAGYFDNWGMEKYKANPIGIKTIKGFSHTLADGIKTLQGLYGVIADYNAQKPDKGAYQYMLNTYFNKEREQ